MDGFWMGNFLNRDPSVFLFGFCFSLVMFHFNFNSNFIRNLNLNLLNKTFFPAHFHVFFHKPVYKGRVPEVWSCILVRNNIVGLTLDGN